MKHHRAMKLLKKQTKTACVFKEIVLQEAVTL